MLAQKNKVGMFVGGFVALALMGFTTWRTIDLLTQVLPASQQIAAFFGVAAFDGGLLAWTFLFLKAKGTDQRTIAGWLAGVDFVAVGIATVMDLILTGMNKGAIAQSHTLYIGAIIVVAAVIMVNVGGGLLYAMNDPKTKQEMQDQKAHDKINDLAEQQIEAHAEMYAPQFAQVKVDAWLAKARMLHGLPQLQQFTTAQQLPSPAKEVTGELVSMPKQDSTPVQMPQLEQDAITGQWRIMQPGQASPFPPAPAPTNQNGHGAH